MSLEEIFTVICLFYFLSGLLALLFISIGLTYKSEKEFRELRNEELKARIRFFISHSKKYED